MQTKPITEEQVALDKEAEKRWIKFKERFIWLDDVPANRKAFPDDNWYSVDGKKDPLRTVVSHVGIDQLKKLLAQEKQLSKQEERARIIPKIHKIRAGCPAKSFARQQAKELLKELERQND